MKPPCPSCQARKLALQRLAKKLNYFLKPKPKGKK